MFYKKRKVQQLQIVFRSVTLVFFKSTYHGHFVSSTLYNTGMNKMLMKVISKLGYPVDH